MSTPTVRSRLVLPADTLAPTEIAYWLAAMEDTRGRTESALAGLHDDAIDWRDGRSESIGSLLYHIAAIEADWLYSDVLEQEIPDELMAWFPVDVRDDSGRLSVLDGESLTQHLVRLDEVRDHLLRAFRGLTPEEFVRTRTLAAYDVTPVWVLHHLMQHEAEHRSEISRLRAAAEAAQK